MSRWLLVLAFSLNSWGQNGTAPVQPLPFSHKQHTTSAHLKCADCHKPGADGEVQTLPKTKMCMSCHQTVKADSAAIKSLQTYAESNRPVPWVRVYEIPGFVNFSHQTHLEGGFTCATCHGQVEERDRLWKEKDISMSGCVSCHKANQGPTDCGVCHDLQH